MIRSDFLALAARRGRGRLGALCLLSALAAGPALASDMAQVTAFKQAVAEASYGSEGVAAFYRETGYAPIFTGADADSQARRVALMAAFDGAADQGLPAGRYSPAMLRAALADVGSTRDRGRAEVEIARLFLTYARDVQSGVLEPRRVHTAIVRDLPRRDPVQLLKGFAEAEPRAYLASLIPASHEYNRLLAEKMRLEYALAHGGWGTKVQAEKLEPGQAGAQVVALRNRLIAKGYLPRSAARSYDGALTKAVQQFQIDHGLTADGVAGPSTLREVNKGVAQRLSQVLVALERERWLNLPEGKGERHVLVNLTDFHATVVDDGKVSFRTKAVVGATYDGKETPEFSDVMEYMELNPTWTVPRGILGRDYLPKLKRNPGAAGYLQVIDSRGRVVPRGSVNFSRYTAANFPFNLRQPPGPRNALGTVKFMFPNAHAIYLHDTPDKHLFGRERRTYSSGCIRLHDPHDFAYHLLARQTDDPQGQFQRILRTGANSRINLEQPIPVHLIYRTAFGQAKGRVNYREDIYGRDAKLWDALQRAGVSLPAVQG